MRTSDPAFLEACAGTTTGDRLTGTVWRGDAPPVEVDFTAWDIAWDASRQVQGQGTFTIPDHDGTLAPWGYGDTLAPGGSVMSLAWESGQTGQRLPMGRWRLRRSKPREQWRLYRTSGDSLRRVPGGGSVTVSADELTAAAVLQRLDAVPGPTRSTCMQEVEHLLDGIMAVSWAPGVVDRPCPALAYGEGRMDAVELLLAALGAVHRMTPDGSLDVLAAPADPAWTIAGGDGGVLIDVDRELSDDALFNGVRSTSQTDAGQPLAERALLSAGPLAWGGPFGRVLGFHTSTSTTSAGVLQDAQGELARQSTGGEVVLPVECVANPAVQTHDAVVVVPQSLAGEQPLVGTVRTMRMASAGSGDGVTPAKRMSLGVAVSPETLEMVAAKVQRVRG